MKLFTKTETLENLRNEKRFLEATNERLDKLVKEKQKLLNVEEFDSKILAKQKELKSVEGAYITKKSELLKELRSIELLIESKKEILYGLIEKQDELDERERNISEQEEKLKLQAQFVEIGLSKVIAS